VGVVRQQQQQRRRRRLQQEQREKQLRWGRQQQEEEQEQSKLRPWQRRFSFTRSEVCFFVSSCYTFLAWTGSFGYFLFLAIFYFSWG
jgi:hypothetical protein